MEQKRINHPEWDEKLFDKYEATGNFKQALAYMRANYTLIPNKKNKVTSKREGKTLVEGLK